MNLNKKVLAGLVAFAAASTSAQAVTVAANDGWELGVSGLVNQFVVMTDNNDMTDDGTSTGNSIDDVNEVRDGLLPAFINFDMKAPTMNGLDIAAHISFSPSTNTTSQQAGTLEQREVYFTVDGSFGQVLAGKAIGLYGSHNILTDQTLFGVGWGVGGNATTTLGGIGFGYDYADWRSQFKWTSPDMNGFKVAFSVNDSAGAAVVTPAGPTGPLTVLSGHVDQEDLRYEGDLSYAGTFDGGSFSAWVSAMMQDQDHLDEDASAWTVGGTLVFGGFEAMAQYSDSESATNDLGALTDETLEWSQYIVQAGYRFAGTTLVSAQYAELTNDTGSGKSWDAGSDDTSDRYTIGVYHDVNANLKLVAEYTSLENDNKNLLEQDILSLGGFVFF